MANKLLKTSFSLGVLFCFYLESLQLNKPVTVKTDLMNVQTNNDISIEDINFDALSYDIVTEKIAINPYYQFNEETIALFALKNNVPVYSTPEEDKEISFEINKRDELKSLGYNSFNQMYKVQHEDKEFYVDEKDFSTDKNLIFDKKEGTRYVNDWVSLKDYPSSKGNNLKELSINNTVELLGKNDNGYCKVKISDIEGFIHEDYLSEGKVNYVTDNQKKVARIAKNNQGTYPCTANYCAAWVSGVYAAAGLGYPGGDAIDFWLQWKNSGSTSIDNIPVGAVVVGSGSGSYMGNRYGHVGVYIGDGKVADNVGYHRIISIEDWAKSQVGYCRGYHGYIGWVWPDNNVLGEGH